MLALLQIIMLSCHAIVTGINRYLTRLSDNISTYHLH